MYQKKIDDLKKAAGIFSWENDPQKNSYEFMSPTEKREAAKKIGERHNKFVETEIGKKIHQHTADYIKRNKLSADEKAAKLKLAKEIASKYKNTGINSEKHSFIDGTKKIDLGIGGKKTTVPDKASHKERKYLEGIIQKETGITQNHDSEYRKHLSKKVDDIMEQMLQKHVSENPHKFDTQKHLDDISKEYAEFKRADRFRKMRNAGRVGGLALGFGGLMYANRMAQKKEQERRDSD